MELAEKKILVVGGSGVLGAQLINQLAMQRAKVLATCTTNESANRIPEVAELKPLLDLSSSDSIQVLSDYLNQNHQIDGIILAAGRVGFGAVSETTESDAQKFRVLAPI